MYLNTELWFDTTSQLVSLKKDAFSLSPLNVNIIRHKLAIKMFFKTYAHVSRQIALSHVTHIYSTNINYVSDVSTILMKLTHNEVDTSDSGDENLNL